MYSVAFHLLAIIFVQLVDKIVQFRGIILNFEWNKEGICEIARYFCPCLTYCFMELKTEEMLVNIQLHAKLHCRHMSQVRI